MNQINIGVLDGHDLFRESFSSLLSADTDFNVCFSCSEIEELSSFLLKEQISLLIVDPGANRENCLRILKEKLHEYPSLKVMVLTDNIDKEYVMKLIESGVSGIYSKHTSSLKFSSAAREIIENQFEFDVKLGPVIREKLISTEIGLARFTQPVDIIFSRRELEILDLICQERTNLEISERLNLSVRTIETHRRRMIEKTGSKNMIGVVMYAFEKHLIRNQQGIKI